VRASRCRSVDALSWKNLHETTESELDASQSRGRVAQAHFRV
jgi:hypothetical protein